MRIRIQGETLTRKNYSNKFLTNSLKEFLSKSLKIYKYYINFSSVAEPESEPVEPKLLRPGAVAEINFNKNLQQSVWRMLGLGKTSFETYFLWN